MTRTFRFGFSGSSTEWDRVLCNKRRVKCPECPTRAHLLFDPEAYRRDRRKDFLLRQNGYFVLRFLAEGAFKAYVLKKPASTGPGQAIKAFEAGFDDILRHPQAWQSIEDDIRRHLVKRLPFGTYYCIEGNEIMIYAIMHMSMHSDYWKRRVD